jgi:hypothetical protein
MTREREKNIRIKGDALSHFAARSIDGHTAFHGSNRNQAKGTPPLRGLSKGRFEGGCFWSVFKSLSILAAMMACTGADRMQEVGPLGRLVFEAGSLSGIRERSGA